MPIPISGQVGVQKLGQGASASPFAQGEQGESLVSELHGRFYQQNYRGSLFCGGMTVTSIANATFTSATTGATATPIIGLWNPASSVVNAVVLQASLGVIITALTNTGGGPFIWMSCLGNAAISTGIVPINRKTLAAVGSSCKVFAGTALTGMTGTLALLQGSALGGGSLFNTSTVDTAVGFNSAFVPAVENFDGSLIVPPGGVIALMATTTPVAQSAASGLLWEEVPV